MTVRCELAGQIHPLTGEPRRRNGHARRDPMPLSVQPARRREIAATYDAARDSDEFRRYWAHADGLDADSANSRSVRSKLVNRSRYEVANNGFADGMTQTHANYLVGKGPALRIQELDATFARRIETVWYRWSKQILLRRKLWCMAHAKVQDGEPFGIVRSNLAIRHPVKLDLVLIETEQCQTPSLPFQVPGYIDGIKFDEFGNPEWYDILPLHPGGQLGFVNSRPEQIPARFVLHWFQMRRPGQHRGVPEFRSTLNVGASSRRFREATVASAETAADISVLLQTAFPPDELDPVTPMTTVEFQKRMMVALPSGWGSNQMKAEHPNATYDSFLRSQINESARPKSIPYNLAACDSSSYNYASGRLDHQTYFIALDVEREDANDLVLDPLFALWWEEAVLTFGWDADPNEPPEHLWDWPKHPVADIQAESSAKDTRLRNGSLYPSQLYSEEGRDFEDELPKMAADYGVTPQEMRQILLHAVFNSQNQQAAMMTATAQAEATKAQAAATRAQLTRPTPATSAAPQPDEGAPDE
jgi:capsid protein